MGRYSLKLIKAHPSIAATGVYPFDKCELPVSGHFCVPQVSGERVERMQLRSERLSCVLYASVPTQVGQSALMCVHMP